MVVKGNWGYKVGGADGAGVYHRAAEEASATPGSRAPGRLLGWSFHGRCKPMRVMTAARR